MLILPTIISIVFTFTVHSIIRWSRESRRHSSSRYNQWRQWKYAQWQYFIRFLTCPWHKQHTPSSIQTAETLRYFAYDIVASSDAFSGCLHAEQTA